MKKTIFTLALLAAAFLNSYATVRTVSNYTPSPGLYTDIQSAINASSAGDTIYVHGSPTNYGGFTLDKSLVLLGAGFNNQNVIGYRSEIAGCCGTQTNASVSNYVIMGFQFHGSSLLIAPNNHDFIMARNFFDGFSINMQPGCYNVTIAENLITGGGSIDFHSNSNIVLTNNVFTSSQNGCFGQGGANLTVSDNLFIATNPATNIPAFENSNGMNVINNIFVNINPNSTLPSCTNCQFANNDMYYVSNPPSAPWTNNGSTDAGNNITLDPLFVNQSFIASQGLGAISSNVNFYELLSGSPCLTSPGGVMGVYGGGGVYDYHHAGAPPFPYISSFFVPNTTVAPGSNLQIDVTGSSHQ